MAETLTKIKTATAVRLAVVILAFGTLTAITFVSSKNTKCTGRIPSHATLCSGDKKDVKSKTPITLATVCSAPKCQYTCNEGYKKSGNACVSTGEGNYFCTGLINFEHSTLCPDDDKDLTKDTPRIGTDSCTEETKCEYLCDEGYIKSSTGNNCLLEGSVMPEGPTNCTGPIPDNATLCDGDLENANYGQLRVPTSNCSIIKCQYLCNEGYVPEDGDCVPRSGGMFGGGGGGGTGNYIGKIFVGDPVYYPDEYVPAECKYDEMNTFFGWGRAWHPNQTRTWINGCDNQNEVVWDGQLVCCFPNSNGCTDGTYTYYHKNTDILGKESPYAKPNLYKFEVCRYQSRADEDWAGSRPDTEACCIRESGFCFAGYDDSDPFWRVGCNKKAVISWLSGSVKWCSNSKPNDGGDFILNSEDGFTYYPVGNMVPSAGGANDSDAGVFIPYSDTYEMLCRIPTKDYKGGGGSDTSGTSETPEIIPTCTGNIPSYSVLCDGDEDNALAGTIRTLVAGCTNTAKCEYTCDTEHILKGTAAGNYCGENITGQCGEKGRSSYCGWPEANSTVGWCDSGQITNFVGGTSPSGSYRYEWQCAPSGGGTAVGCSYTYRPCSN